MGFTPEDERLLSIAETMPISGTDIADSADEEQEKYNVDSAGDIDPQAAIRESVRLDVLRILARECKNELSVVRYKELLAHPRISEQFAAIEDEKQRGECIIEVFKDIAEEALDASIVLDERYGEINPLSTDYVRLIFQYSRMLLVRHGFVACEQPEPAKPLSAEEEEKILRDAEITGVDMAVVISTFDGLFDDEPADADFLCAEDDDDIIESTESIHKKQISLMLSIISDLGAGRMSIQSLMRIRSHPELRQQLVMIDKDARDACFYNVFYAIAENALRKNPLIAAAVRGDTHAAHMNVANYVIRLMERHGIA